MSTPESSEQAAEARAREAARNELRHRLADSFQLVTSLIRLRLRRADSPESRGDLSWLLDVVTALGLLQQRLASADPGAFAAYLTDVGGFWRRVAGERAKVTVEAERFRVGEQRAATLALIAHELIRDTVERAGEGQIAVEVRLLRRDGGRGELVLRETGGVAERERDLWLVAGLVEQLGGRLTQTAGEVRFEFQAERVDPRAQS